MATAASYLQARHRKGLGDGALLLAVVWTVVSYAMVLVLVAMVIAYIAFTNYTW